jgi:hypothetical protein
MAVRTDRDEQQRDLERTKRQVFKALTEINMVKRAFVRIELLRREFLDGHSGEESDRGEYVAVGTRIDSCPNTSPRSSAHEAGMKRQ